MMISDILANSAKVFGVTREQIISPCRDMECRRARFAVFWVARQHRGYTFQRIGNAVGNRDHSTVMNGFARAGKWRDRDIEYREALDKVISLGVPKENLPVKSEAYKNHAVNMGDNSPVAIDRFQGTGA